MQKLILECDRCMKIISDEEEATIEKRNIRVYDRNGDEYDICSECFESLEKWFDREPEGRLGCEFCKHGRKGIDERPCRDCKHNFLDMFEPKENEER